MGFPALPEGENLEVALRAAKSFAGKVVDPPLEEIGLIFQDHVRSFRLRRQIALLLKARERLEAAGIEPHTVPLKTVVPLLEGASLEDDPDQQKHERTTWTDQVFKLEFHPRHFVLCHKLFLLFSQEFQEGFAKYIVFEKRSLAYS